MSTVDTVRAACLKQFVALDPQHLNYFTELEHQIFDICGKPQSYSHIMSFYYRKYIQLYYNLQRYWSLLTQQYTPSELIHMGEVKLNPQVKQEREHNAQQQLLYKQILSKGIEDEDDDKDTDSAGEGNKCGKCKNTKNISITLRQLRSADEQMTIFYKCNKCTNEWRVG
jgi:DNA-directed RNA polymerase subunit M/transcription elongation factor TFIIS